MFRYRVYDEEGDELGEAAYVSRIKPDETIWLAGARKFRVVNVIDLEGEGRYEGMLLVSAGR